MSDTSPKFFANSDPLGPEARTKLRQLLADAGVVDTVDEALNPVREAAPDGRIVWRELAERLAAGYGKERDTYPQRSSGLRGQPLRWGVFKEQPLLGSIFQGRTLRRVVWPAMLTVLCTVVAVVTWQMGVYHPGRRVARSVMTYATGNGERATIVLPDGGTVALNVASRLDVPMDYMAGHRTLRLVGEGLFTVSHHDGTPLTVLVGGTVARVLGTSFVARYYATDTAALVAVRDGKVAVGPAVVTANQLVEVGQSGVPHIRPSDTSPFAFATGTLTINGLLLPAAIVELDRWYDTDIRLGDSSLAKQRMKGTFGMGSLGDLAESLGLMYDVRVVRDGRVLTLYPKR